MKNKMGLAVGCLFVLFVACGKDRVGGESETHWMKQCDTNRDCDGGTVCACGMCTEACAERSDCSSLGAETNCVRPGDVPTCGEGAPAGVCVAACASASDCTQGFECSLNGCVPSSSAHPMVGSGGAGGATDEGLNGGAPQGSDGDAGGSQIAGGEASVGSDGSGGVTCKPDPGGFAGAVHRPAAAPPPGAFCPTELEGFRLCTPVAGPGVNPSHSILSGCSGGLWVTLEDPSDCENPACEPDVDCGYTLQCNQPGASEGVCCDAPRYCSNIGVCDGERWWVGPEPRCGNGRVDLNEECDDGNTFDDDACLRSCSHAECGDDFVRSDVEECDDGAQNGPYPAECSSQCTRRHLCGNGELDPGEQCDYGPRTDDAEGNYLRGNYDYSDCLENCLWSTCGDGFAHLYTEPGQQSPSPLEDCDNSNGSGSDACNNECGWNRCGDGIEYADDNDGNAAVDGNPEADNPFPWEECDDGNTANGDGCDAACRLDE